MGKLFLVCIIHMIPNIMFNGSILNNIATTIEKSNLVEVPEIEINFHIMGTQQENKDIYHDIVDNMAYLNEEFEGYIKFKFKRYSFHNKKAQLPEIHKSLIGIDDDWVEDIVQPIEHQGTLNVFVFDTYVEEGSNAALMGFTPILSAQHDKYGMLSPSFDRMYIAFKSLKNKTTIVHEMGHYLGLRHPWEMSDSDKIDLGIANKSDELCNHMSYNHAVNKFTKQQLDQMRVFALKFRDYLTKETRWISYNN